MVSSPEQYWESVHQQKLTGEERRRRKKRMGDSGKDTHLEIFHTCLDPREPLYSMSSVTANTLCEEAEGNSPSHRKFLSGKLCTNRLVM